MAQKTVLNCDQGQTYIEPLELVGEGVTDFTGYTVRFMVKQDFDLENSAAIIDQTLTPDAVTGQCQVYVADEITAAFVPGEYKYQAKLINPAGEVVFTAVEVFNVMPVLIQGATP